MPARLTLLLLLLLSATATAQPDADGVYTIAGPERTAAAIEATWATMPPLAYTPPAGRFAQLPRTAAILKNGGELRVVMLGDSIVNDASRSSWEHVLMRNVPGLTVKKTTVVRGSTGAWWYREAGRVQKYVLPHRPDLVIIGGISHRDDIDAVRDVVAQIRAGAADGLPADILLTSPAFGTIDPNDHAQWMALWRVNGDPETHSFAKRLARLADEIKTGFLDLSAAWGHLHPQLWGSGRRVQAG